MPDHHTLRVRAALRPWAWLCGWALLHLAAFALCARLLVATPALHAASDALMAGALFLDFWLWLYIAVQWVQRTASSNTTPGSRLPGLIIGLLYNWCGMWFHCMAAAVALTEGAILDADLPARTLPDVAASPTPELFRLQGARCDPDRAVQWTVKHRRSKGGGSYTTTEQMIPLTAVGAPPTARSTPGRPPAPGSPTAPG